MEHFRIAKVKETIKYFYPLILPSKKNSIWFIYFCIKNIDIVLCESRSVYMSSVTQMGHVNLKLKEKYILIVFRTILINMTSRTLRYNMTDKDLVLLKKT